MMEYIGCTIKNNIDVKLVENGELEAWLKSQVKTKSWILAHALDGLIWGAVTSDGLMTSHDAAPDVSPPLRIETLQQLCLFNPDFEIKLWRVADAWKAIKITDADDSSVAPIDEEQLLWGTYGTVLDEGFILLEDGVQGMRHVIPPFENSQKLQGDLGTLDKKYIHRACLKVRHYLGENSIGVNSIALSRLVELGVKTYD